MTDIKEKPPFDIAKANYDCLMNKPEKDRDLIDLMAIFALQGYYPELKS